MLKLGRVRNKGKSNNIKVRRSMVSYVLSLCCACSLMSYVISHNIIIHCIYYIYYITGLESKLENEIEV